MSTPRRRRSSPRIAALYSLAILREFRWTLIMLGLAIALGAVLYAITPHASLNGARPTLIQSIYGGWMALLAQPLFSPPETWYLTILCAVYPLIGAVVIGEGVIRLALLLMSKRRGEKEWTRVMASTYRDHVIVCGLGHLGFRVLEQLVASGVPVIALERRKSARFVPDAKDLDIPVLIRDMKDDDALIDAGIKHARAIIIATNDPLANLEVALDARRMNPKIRVVMRMFDEQIADKLSEAMDVDVAFSSSQLAAPIVAALALQNHAPQQKVLASSVIGGVTHVTVELTSSADDRFSKRSIAQIESDGNIQVLAHAHQGAHTNTSPTADTVIQPGDTLVIHTSAANLGAMNAMPAISPVSPASCP